MADVGGNRELVEPQNVEGCASTPQEVPHVESAGASGSVNLATARYGLLALVLVAKCVQDGDYSAASSAPMDDAAKTAKAEGVEDIGRIDIAADTTVIMVYGKVKDPFDMMIRLETQEGGVVDFSRVVGPGLVNVNIPLEAKAGDVLHTSDPDGNYYSYKLSAPQKPKEFPSPKFPEF